MIESYADRISMLEGWNTVDFTPGNNYPNTTGSTVTINCIFYNEYVEIDGVTTAAIMALCESSDITGAVEGSMIEHETIKYKVMEVEPDGTGITVLLLEG